MLTLTLCVVMAGAVAALPGCRDAPSTPTTDDAQPNASWVTAQVTAPGVTYVRFDSRAAGTAVSYHVYAPPQVAAEPTRRFPVLYWLHGTGGGLGGIPTLAAHFDTAIRAGLVPPLFVVFANGMAESMWADSKDGRVLMETVVARDLVADVDTRFRTMANRQGRLLEGFSMGGYGAARIAWRFPDVFSAVSLLAAGPLDLDFDGPRARANPAQRARIFQSVYGSDLAFYRALSPLTVANGLPSLTTMRPRIRMVIGTLDDTRPGSEWLRAKLDSLAVPHEYTAIPNAGHDTMALLRGLGTSGWSFYRTP